MNTKMNRKVVGLIMAVLLSPVAKAGGTNNGGGTIGRDMGGTIGSPIKADRLNIDSNAKAGGGDTGGGGTVGSPPKGTGGTGS